MGKGMRKRVLWLGLALAILAAGIAVRSQNRLEERAAQTRSLLAANRLYHFVEALETYGGNLHIMMFAKEDPVYAYKLQEALGAIKYGAAVLAYDADAGVFPASHAQALRDLSRQLSNFTYRFLDTYPEMEPETEAAVSEMARRISASARRLDDLLAVPETEPWVEDPLRPGEWLRDKGYRMEEAEGGRFLEEVGGLLERNEQSLRTIWEKREMSYD